MRRTQYLYSLIIILLLLASPISLGSADKKNTHSARTDFIAAENALKAGDLGTYHILKRKLLDYSLAPYLEYQEIRQNLASQQPEAIRAFLLRHKDTPLSNQLMHQWLNLLAEKRRWETYLDFSTRGGNVKQRCHRLRALITTGQQALTFPEVGAIWLNGRSRPNACDPVFKAWIDAGHLTAKLVWQRIELAMAARQTRLARYLKRFLPTADQAWVERWIALHRNPEKIDQLLTKPHPMQDEIIVHTVRRLARKDGALALDTWQKYHSKPIFTDQQHLSVSRTLAAYLVREPQDSLIQRLDGLVPAHLRLDPKLSDKWFQAALQQNDWNRVLITIENLSGEEKLKERWRYWKARALIKLGQTEEGEGLLKSLSKQRSYYGFLAADRLGDNLYIQHQPLSIEKSQVSRVATLPGLIRARELIALGRDYEARREWNMALQNRTTEELKAAAKLATEWNWPSQTIITLARIRHWNDLELRFPLNHRQQVDRNAKDHGIDSAWIYAILRQESAFVTDARSSAGALGLMQLMPNTARQVASKAKRGPITSKDLFLPKINIELGTDYLTQVYRQLQDNPVLATAAYNAGPHRVLKWLPDETQSTDVWIETVPFHETREYLKRVLAYTLIYTHRLGGNPTSLPAQWMKPIEAATFKETDSKQASDA
ncbi:MAG: transglycosylase SLT domain-containing protein [Pseudomonadota bacterium]